MPAPTAPIDICKMAVSHCGERQTGLSSITEPESALEELLALWYDQTRLDLLRDYAWNFAQEYTVLARAGDGKDGYEDKYALPTDCVRLNSVGEYITDPITDYQIYGSDIHCSNGTSLPIRYNTDVIDVRQMDAGFVTVFALALAQNIAYDLTKKKSVEDKITERLAMALPKKTSVDGQERPPVRIQRSKYLSARHRSSLPGYDNRYYRTS